MPVSPSKAQGGLVSPDTPAQEAVACALLGFAEVLDEKTAGVIAGADAEALHDFRVELRRTRSVVKLVGDVLPAKVATRASRDLTWLADLTTPVRDADVMLAELGDADLTESLSGFLASVRRGARRDRRALAKALSSKRYAEFSADWRVRLRSSTRSGKPPQEMVQAEPRQQRTTVQAVADEQLEAAYTKVARRGAALTLDSPAAQVHRLRKRCKELRYLLEIFRGLYPEADVDALIKRLRKLQDVLGDFQDRTVRIDAAHAYVDRSPSISAAEAFAVGQYAGEQIAAQRRAQAALIPRIRQVNSTAHLFDRTSPAAKA